MVATGIDLKQVQDTIARRVFFELSQSALGPLTLEEITEWLVENRTIHTLVEESDSDILGVLFKLFRYGLIVRSGTGKWEITEKGWEHI